MLPDTVRSQVNAAIVEVTERLILPRFRNLADGEISSKTSPTDLVTTADIEAEKALTETLSGLLPGSFVIGEEAASEDPAILDRLTGPGLFWIVDPVDGTRNFVNGSDNFGTMVALVEEGEVLEGWIHLPRRGQSVWAAKGEGAWLNGERLTNPEGTPPAAAFGDYNNRFVASPFRERMDASAAGFARLRKSGCSAADYVDCATGGIDFILTGKLMPWDHSAGTLIVREAGGRSALLETGEVYLPRPVPDQPMLTVRYQDDWPDYAKVWLGA